MAVSAEKLKFLHWSLAGSNQYFLEEFLWVPLLNGRIIGQRESLRGLANIQIICLLLVSIDRVSTIWAL